MMGIKGDLQYMNLADLVQMVCLDRRSAMLTLRHHAAGRGVIFFAKGQIVHAEAGDLVGEEAVYHLLSWPEGTFEMSEQVEAPTQTIHAPWNRLLMEGLRLIDEQTVGLAIQQIESRQELSLAEMEQDNDLEQDMIVVFSRIEQVRAQLAEKKTWKQPALAIQRLTDIINETTTFAETLPGEAANPAYLESALSRAGENYPAIKLMRVEYTHLSAKIAAQLYNSWSGSQADRKLAFKEIGEGMLVILETYFAYFVSCFHSSIAAGQWRETCEIFLAELKQIIGKIQF